MWELELWFLHPSLLTHKGSSKGIAEPIVIWKKKEGNCLQPIWHVPMADGEMAHMPFAMGLGPNFFISWLIYIFGWGEKTCPHSTYQVHSRNFMLNHCSLPEPSQENAVNNIQFCYFLLFSNQEVNQRNFSIGTTGPMEGWGESEGLNIAGL